MPNERTQILYDYLTNPTATIDAKDIEKAITLKDELAEILFKTIPKETYADRLLRFKAATDPKSSKLAEVFLAKRPHIHGNGVAQRIFTEITLLEDIVQHGEALYTRLSDKTLSFNDSEIAGAAENHKQSLYRQVMDSTPEEIMEKLAYAISISDETGEPDSPLSKVFHYKRSLGASKTAKQLTEEYWNRKADIMEQEEPGFIVSRDPHERRCQAEARELFTKLHGCTNSPAYLIRRAQQPEEFTPKTPGHFFLDRLRQEIIKRADTPEESDVLIKEILERNPSTQTALSKSFKGKIIATDNFPLIAFAQRLCTEFLKNQTPPETEEALSPEVKAIRTYDSTHRFTFECYFVDAIERHCNQQIRDKSKGYSAALEFLKSAISIDSKTNKPETYLSFLLHWLIPISGTDRAIQRVQKLIKKIETSSEYINEYVYPTLRDTADTNHPLIGTAGKLKDKLFEALKNDLDSKETIDEEITLLKNATNSETALGKAFAHERGVLFKFGPGIKNQVATLLKEKEEAQDAEETASSEPLSDPD